MGLFNGIWQVSDGRNSVRRQQITTETFLVNEIHALEIFVSLEYSKRGFCLIFRENATLSAFQSTSEFLENSQHGEYLLNILTAT